MRGAAVLALVTLGLAAPAAPAAPVTARAHLDRTALWPGDRVRYTIELLCAPGVDVLADDLAADKLPLTGLELVSSSIDRREETGGVTRYVARYEATAYALDTPPLIGALRVRYHERRVGAAGGPAGEVVAPGASLALRSTMPEVLEEARLRDAGAPHPAPAVLGWLAPLGAALLLLTALPVALGASLVVRRGLAAARARRARPPGRDLRQDLASLRGLDARSDAARREGYDRLEALLRERLAQVAGPEARALTAAELGAWARERPGLVPADLPAVMAECEVARYARAGLLPPPERFASGVDAAAALLGSR